MKNAGYYFVLFACIGLSLTSCYTLSFHQTGKTLGKNKAAYQLIGGISDFPAIDDQNNVGDRDFIFPRAAVQFGVTEYIDIGAIVGAGQLGLSSKFQLIGDKYSRFAVSTGLNLNSYSDAILLGGREMRFLDLPLYLSYDFTNKLTFYTTPVLSYFNGRDYGDLIFQYENKFEYFTKGWVNGIMVKLPRNINCSLEVAWQSELYSNTYTFNTTVGISMRYDLNEYIARRSRKFNARLVGVRKWFFGE